MRQLADVVVERGTMPQFEEQLCDEFGNCEDPGGGGNMVNTYLTRIQTIHLCDGGTICVEANEFEFRATAQNGFHYPEWPRLTGVPPDAVWDTTIVVNLCSLEDVGYVDIPVVETDNLTDDNYKIADVIDNGTPVWLDVRLNDPFQNGDAWTLWKQGEDYLDYFATPKKNTVKVTFAWF